MEDVSFCGVYCFGENDECIDCPYLSGACAGADLLGCGQD